MKELLISAILTAAALAVGSFAPGARAQGSTQPPQMAQLLFVQNAAGVEVGTGGRTLTLKGLSPTTSRAKPTEGHGRSSNAGKDRSSAATATATRSRADSIEHFESVYRVA